MNRFDYLLHTEPKVWYYISVSSASFNSRAYTRRINEQGVRNKEDEHMSRAASDPLCLSRESCVARGTDGLFMS